MHYFQSQVVSTVFRIKNAEGYTAFNGHYMFGDGGSFLLVGVAGMLTPLAIFFLHGPYSLLLSLFLVSSCAVIFLCRYRKTIVFNTDLRKIQVTTRKVFEVKNETYRFEDALLLAERIHIRRAHNCGALDLILPNCKIRLAVLGRFDRVLEELRELTEKTGIETKNSE